MGLPFKTSVEGRFLAALKERSDRWANAKIAARLEVSQELEFWYLNEFGTGSKGDPAHGASGHSYPIRPVEAKELRFPQGGQIVYRDAVMHPGVKPSRSVTKVLPEIREMIAQLVHEAFLNGAADDPKKLRDAVVAAVEKAKALIVESMAQNIPGVRELEPESGRLGGAHAADVFEEEAEVVDHSSGV